MTAHPLMVCWHKDTILADGENGRRSEADDDIISLLHRSQMLCQVVVLRNDKADAIDQEAD